MMDPIKKLAFKDLRAQIAVAIKESCYTSEVRLYNIANAVPNIETYGLVSGFESEQDLLKIIDQTIKDSVGVGCDLSVVVKGIFLGAFRSWPFKRQDAYQTIRVLIRELLKSVFIYNGNVKEAIEGLLSAVFYISMEFKLSAQESLVAAREDVIFSAKALSPGFAVEVNRSLPKIDEQK